jgi:hypothetical protein
MRGLQGIGREASERHESMGLAMQLCVSEGTRDMEGRGGIRKA